MYLNVSFLSHTCQPCKSMVKYQKAVRRERKTDYVNLELVIIYYGLLKFACSASLYSQIG